MNIEEIVKRFNEQNVEVIKQNIRLNQRVTLLEQKIIELQKESFELKLENERLKRKKQSRKVKKKTSNISVYIDNDQSTKQEKHAREKRSCANKPVNYALPNVKSKLRKGDPFTFGNEQ
ncbi:hypothetical protein BCV72DRAFT_43303 [Rhizopus microsporus var. microsporus]|uniref:Shugoshin C-terminal domain-containing protein n=1 Tax=Rhizopus microsporus var. microsporus TaxID=86635 RepID=A0A1X0RD90_RHIZD|nr:hypothetical protein BCV72DRAFT_43303 [Rhizopus microsporus var. microsporus]